MLEFFVLVDDILRADPELAEIDALVRQAAPELLAEDGSALRLPGIGYGRYRYCYATGREGESYRISVCRRAHGFSVYCCGIDADGGYLAESYRDRLGKVSVGKSCVRFKRLSDLHREVLCELFAAAAISH